MTDAERIARLGVETAGSGATVMSTFAIWALDEQLTDVHLERISSWADLEYLVACGCPITDTGLTTICRFHRLETLSIGATKITSNAIVAADLPTTLTCLGLYEIQLTDEAAIRSSRLTSIQILNFNDCGLSLDAFHQLVDLPRLRGIEALGCPVPDDAARLISSRKPNTLLRLDSGVWMNGDVKRPPKERP
ncbi:MAG: hypothetical protein ABL888_18210 [Pirellulaceae bacterium]